LAALIPAARLSWTDATLVVDRSTAIQNAAGLELVPTRCASSCERYLPSDRRDLLKVTAERERGLFLAAAIAKAGTQ
jgi:hypothetical protein